MSKGKTSIRSLCCYYPQKKSKVWTGEGKYVNTPLKDEDSLVKADKDVEAVTNVEKQRKYGENQVAKDAKDDDAPDTTVSTSVGATATTTASEQTSSKRKSSTERHRSSSEQRSSRKSDPRKLEKGIKKAEKGVEKAGKDVERQEQKLEMSKVKLGVAEHKLGEKKADATQP